MDDKIELEFDVRNFIEWHGMTSGASNIGAYIDLPKVTAKDIKIYMLKNLAQKLRNIAFQDIQWDSFRKSDYRFLDISSPGGEVISYQLDYYVEGDLEAAAKKLNELIVADNLDPTYTQLIKQLIDEYEDPFAKEDIPAKRTMRNFDNLVSNAYSVLMDAVRLTDIKISVADLIGTDYNRNTIDLPATEKVLSTLSAKRISERTGIPQATIIKYQQDNDKPNHRSWISENAIKLASLANAEKYNSYHGI